MIYSIDFLTSGRPIAPIAVGLYSLLTRTRFDARLSLADEEGSSILPFRWQEGEPLVRPHFGAPSLMPLPGGGGTVQLHQLIEVDMYDLESGNESASETMSEMPAARLKSASPRRRGTRLESQLCKFFFVEITCCGLSWND